jgi:glucose/arabinose dehydrogenase
VRRLAALAIAAALAVAGCSSGDDDTAAPPPTATPTTATPTSAAPGTASSGGPSTPPLKDVHVRLTGLARVDSPTAMAVRTGDDHLYVTEQSGRVVRVPHDGGAGQTVIDLRTRIRSGGEQGLLGIAFSPDGATMYLDYTDTNGDTHVDAVDIDVAGATGNRRTLLTVDQPYSNHNGGQLVVRPDGTLWIALGDGGSGGDPQRHAQDLRSLLGKILRIDPRPQASAAGSGDTASTGKPYSIPPDNPFVGRSGARPEIWAYGLRNPWRFSFDRETGDLWIGDVGQGEWEEVDLEPAGSGGGRNYGWNLREGDHPYNGGAKPAGAVDPILEYGHADGGVAVTGGYVYRGSRIPALRGAYLYADYADGRVKAVRADGGRIVDRADLGVKAAPLSSFGEDGDGELYVLSLAGRLYRVDPA